MTIEALLMFFVSTVGMTHIIVDASIMEWFRNFVKHASIKLKIPAFGNVVDCYLCCGTWCGFFLGMVWISFNPFKILACGFAGGFLSQFAAILINFLESQIMMAYPSDSTEVKDGN